MQAAARILGLSLSLVAACMGAACASGQRSADPAAQERYPDDFAIDATVLAGPGTPESTRAEDQQAKYIVLPDGSLHADASEFLDISTRPGRARFLYEEQEIGRAHV